jgi:hypothetical protein
MFNVVRMICLSKQILLPSCLRGKPPVYRIPDAVGRRAPSVDPAGRGRDRRARPINPASPNSPYPPLAPPVDEQSRPNPPV